jgi:hypothetical protein
MPQHFKVHELLNREELDALEAFAREPGRTVDECTDYLLAHGFTIVRSSVHRWMRQFLLSDRFTASNETARALMDAAKQGGTVAISDAAVLQLSQMLFEQLVKLQSDKKVNTKELWAVSMALKNVVTGKRHVEKLKSEIQTALDEASKAAGSGKDANAVVAKMREVLGIAA